MKVLNMELSDMEFLDRISCEEALEFVREGEEVILRLNERDFYGIDNERDLQNAFDLYKQKIYSTFEIYI